MPVKRLSQTTNPGFVVCRAPQIVAKMMLDSVVSCGRHLFELRLTNSWFANVPERLLMREIHLGLNLSIAG